MTSNLLIVNGIPILSKTLWWNSPQFVSIELARLPHWAHRQHKLFSFFSLLKGLALTLPYQDCGTTNSFPVLLGVVVHIAYYMLYHYSFTTSIAFSFFFFETNLKACAKTLAAEQSYFCTPVSSSLPNVSGSH